MSNEREYSVRRPVRKAPEPSLAAPIYAIRAPEGVLLRLAGRSYPLTREAARILARELVDAADPS